MTRRTQAERSATTRAALIAAGRALFGEHGFAGVGTEAIVTQAGVGRGALYHHFADKTELFAAVLEQVEADVSEQIAAHAFSGPDPSFEAAMKRAVTAWLDACGAPDVQRIVLSDGPSVLGWTRWRSILQPYAFTLIEGALGAGMDDGSVIRLPIRPLAHTFATIAEEAAMYVASADDPEQARRDMVEVTDWILGSLAPPAP